MKHLVASILATFLITGSRPTTAAPDMTAAFDLPPGFHIYKVAGPELSGGSYDLAFDAQGRLLVGDGTAVRRLVDRDGDEVFDGYDVIATGLGPRGPQGLLIDGDRLFAVGDDGLQLFDGYNKGGALTHRGRLGQPFLTGGDHTAHTILRGHDGYLYFVTGDGGGAEGRKHITRDSSPALYERAATVFRIDPTGTHWEAVSRGGRNPPNLGQNYLGDLFSLDSDMEWHVGTPWYRPVRLNHWLTGGDQGWLTKDALPPYFIDALPGVLDVGRGSPDWGVFYEHRQLPPKYQDAFLVCDYPSKNIAGGHYESTGRLLALFPRRQAAGWTASLEVLARPRPGARDEHGLPIQFALVDIEVAPDGSLYLSDHNQGIWRLYHDGAAAAPAKLPPHVPVDAAPMTGAPGALIARALALPQPAAEWSRVQALGLRAALGDGPWGAGLRAIATDRKQPARQRLRAIRLLAPDFAGLPGAFIASLGRDPNPELRGQSAWLAGIRGRADEQGGLVRALSDKDAFVRRRAAEALTRGGGAAAVPALVERLADPERLVRYAAMAALAHRPTAQWLPSTTDSSNVQVRLHGLVAAVMRRQVPAAAETRQVVSRLLKDVPPGRGDVQTRLDLLRVLTLLDGSLGDGDAHGARAVRDQIVTHVVGAFPDSDAIVRREQARLLGLARATAGYAPLVAALLAEPDFVAQFHLARALSRITPPSDAHQTDALVGWMIRAQVGWFARLDDKGREFGDSWLTVLTDLGQRHAQPLLARFGEVNLAAPLGRVAMDLLAAAPGADDKLVGLYRSTKDRGAKLQILTALEKRRAPALGTFFRAELVRASDDAALTRGLLQAVVALPAAAVNVSALKDALDGDDAILARTAAGRLVELRAPFSQTLADALLGWLTRERGEAFAVFDRALASLAAGGPGAAPPGATGHVPDDPARKQALTAWTAWYRQRFGKDFVLPAKEKTDDDVYAYIMKADLAVGDTTRGRGLFERLQCAGCHGGPGAAAGGPFIAPDLTGITRRLSRAELADAIVYPSKQVAERFRTMLVEVKDGEPLSGFVTDQSGDEIALVDRAGVHRVPKSRVRSIRPQPVSMMPERLVGFLAWDELQDLLSFLGSGDASAQTGPGKAPTARPPAH